MEQKMNNITWVQLSDLHIFDSTDWDLMLEGYRKLSERIHPDFIVITGDYRHKKYEYNKDYSHTLEFLEEMVNIFKVKKEDVFLIPGNHDVEEYEFREESIRTIVEKIESDPDVYKKYLNKKLSLDTAFESYEAFIRKFYGDEVTDDRVNNPEKIICLPWRNMINIIMLNTALISDGNKEHGEIIDINALSKITINKEKPTIVLGHHDFESICESHRERMISIFEKLNVKAYLCGDAHKEEIKSIEKYDVISERVPCIICGKSAVQAGDDYSDVGIIEYNWEDDGFVYVRPYKWGKKYNFIKADDFIYDIDKDYRFFMSEELEIASGKESDIEKHAEVIDIERKNLVALKTYPDITEAHKDIANDIREGGFFNFYGLRGATFIGTSEVNAIVKELKSDPKLQIKFLISYPFSEEIRHRLKNIPEFVDSAKCEEKWRDTYKKVNDLRQDYKNYDNAFIRFHDTPLIFRLLFTKKHLYMGYYEPGKNSVNTEIYQFDSSSSTYKTYSAFFDYQWKKARHDVPSKIPATYSFLKEKFSVHPSLVINVTSLCNMNCIYCPTGGENLCKFRPEECLREDVLRKVVVAFKKHVLKDKEDPILRITGGEPLIDKENRRKTAVILNAAKDYKKIVLCTNAIFLKEAYNEYKKDWDAVKSKLLLKISLDTLKIERFCEITRTGDKGKDLFKILIDNINFANDNGFRIELNLVATRNNLQQPEDIIEVFEFAQNIGLVGLKILTVNDFGGNVTIEQRREEQDYISKILADVIQQMRKREYEEKEVYLNDNKGIQMRRFIAVSDTDEKCTLTIVDHHNSATSITPRRTFSEFCASCKYFPTSEKVRKEEVQPCATGIMSLTLRADGLLSPCRLCQEKGRNIKNVRSNTHMEKTVNNSLKAFDNCFHMTM